MRSESASVEETERLAHLALDIYRGDFLASEDAPGIDPARNSLRTRVAKTIERLGRMLTEAGEGDKAAALYERAIDGGIPSASFRSSTTSL